MDKNRYIGDKHGLPWGRLQKTDIKRFRSLTENHTIILGKNFYNELTDLLPNREHIVVTHEQKSSQRHLQFMSFESALSVAKKSKSEIFIVGGAQIYELFLPHASKIYLTEIDASYDGDTQFPVLDDSWVVESVDCRESDASNKHDYCFINYSRSKK